MTENSREWAELIRLAQELGYNPDQVREILRRIDEKEREGSEES